METDVCRLITSDALPALEDSGTAREAACVLRLGKLPRLGRRGSGE